MEIEVLFLGTAGSAPTRGRGLPSTLVRCGGEQLLFDCGEGTQRQLLRSGGLVALDAVFITHFHADHFLGLPGMLKTFSLQGRDAPLAVHGPPGLKALFDALRPVIGRVTYDLSLVEVEAGTPVPGAGYTVTSFGVAHGVPAYGYAIVEDVRPGRFDAARARELGVEEGPDFGRLQGGEPVQGSLGQVRPEQVLGDARAGRKVVISGDTAPSEMTRVAAHEASLLVHEATFGHADAERAAATGHSTGQAAAMLAAQAQVTLLALVHISQRYQPSEIEQEAREAFPNTVVPRDFDRVEVPFPERGAPVHVPRQKREPPGAPGG
ncbi:MAG: ribonuclease Z [Thermoleophilaceae bacterium]|nr:ribonuclease Z [Thermoleophilaceae bacterium]